MQTKFNRITYEHWEDSLFPTKHEEIEAQRQVFLGLIKSDVDHKKNVYVLKFIGKHKITEYLYNVLGNETVVRLTYRSTTDKLMEVSLVHQKTVEKCSTYVCTQVNPK